MAVEAVVEAGEEVVVRAEVNLIMVIIEEVVRIKVRVQAEVRIRIKIVIIRVRVRAMEDTPGIRPPDTRTCPRSSPASGTGHMGNQLIFVWSQGPAPGRTFGSRSLIINEIQTGSVMPKMLKIFIIYSTRLHLPK